MRKPYSTQALSRFNLLLRLVWTGVFYRFLKGGVDRQAGKGIVLYPCFQVIIASLLALVLLVAPLTSQAVSFTGLGALPGGDYISFVHGVSADGSVAVGESRGANTPESNYEATRWTAGGGMQSLNGLSSSTNSWASDVSSNGSTVVGFAGGQAFRWTAPGNVQILGNLGNYPGAAGSYSSASGVSADGKVVVGTSSSPLGQEAFLWQQDIGMQGLGELTGKCCGSTATAVSADGNVVVGHSGSLYDAYERGTEAFRWDKSGGMQGLGDLPGGQFSSIANGVSAKGAVIVGAGSTGFGPYDFEAFRWNANDGMQGLGYLPGSSSSVASDVSADGNIVVGGSGGAFIWDPAHGMRSLLDLLVTAGVDLTGWVLSAATAISADGLTVVGNGINPEGQQEAWIARLDSAMVVPEIEAAGAPAALAILIGGILLIGEKARDFRSRRDRDGML